MDTIHCSAKFESSTLAIHMLNYMYNNPVCRAIFSAMYVGNEVLRSQVE